MEIKRLTVTSIDESKPSLRIRLMETKTGKSHDWYLSLKTDLESVEFSALVFDINQAGRDNGIATIRLGAAAGDKHETKKVSFPKGCGMIQQSIIDPKLFHMSWTMAQLYSPKEEGIGPIYCEVKLENAPLKPTANPSDKPSVQEK